MSSRIFRNIVFVSLFVLVCSLCISLFFFYQYLIKNQTDLMRDELAIMTSQPDNSFAKDDSADYRITLVEADGTVKFDSYYDEATLENHGNREEIKQALISGQGEAKRWSDTDKCDIIYVAEKVDSGDVLRIAYKSDHIRIVLVEMFVPLFLLVIVLLFATSFIARRTSAKIVEPINKIDLDKPLVSASPYEEVAPLLKRLDEDRRARERSDQSRKDFTANVSHELKTPLQGIAGSVELLEGGMVESTDYPRFLSHIKNETSRMITLVDDIILLSRLDERREVRKETVDFRALITSSIDSRSEYSNQHHVTIFSDLDECEIFSSERLLRHIVDNLLDNAIKYNKPSGFVNVSLKSYDDKAILEVKDSGIGMSARDQKRVFERFYRVDKSRSKESGGTGLGLSIVKNAANELGAKIDIESELDVGTTIEITIPT